MGFNGFSGVAEVDEGEMKRVGRLYKTHRAVVPTEDVGVDMEAIVNVKHFFWRHLLPPSSHCEICVSLYPFINF